MKAPIKDRVEWKELLTGKINPKINNFFFQMKITQARTQVEKGIIPIDKAVDELHVLCQKFIRANNMVDDLKVIFGENYEEEDNKRNEEVVNLDDKNDSKNDKNELLKIQLNHEKQMMFYKNQLFQKEKELKEKENLILKLQEDNVILKKKNDILYESIYKVDKMRNEKESNKKEEDKSKRKSFFNFFTK